MRRKEEERKRRRREYKRKKRGIRMEKQNRKRQLMEESIRF